MMAGLLRWFFVGVAIGVITACPLAHGQGEICHDVLALQSRHFPTAVLIAEMPDDFCGGNLDWTFGTSLRQIRRLLSTGKVTSWRVHFFNGAGLRNGQLGSYEPHAGHTVKSFSTLWERGGGKLRQHLKSRVVAYCDLFAPWPQIALSMSPTLEHNLSSAAFRAQARTIRRWCPRATIIDNPVKGIGSTRGFQIERHGVNAGRLSPPCGMSFDGDDIVDANVFKVFEDYVRCKVYAWTHSYNCRHNGPFQDPRSRTECPTIDILRMVFAYPQGLPLAPAVEGCRAIERPRLFKPLADNKGTGDIRANKPLWLSPRRLPTVEVVTATGGHSVASLGLYGPFEGGGWRYYSGIGSNLTPQGMREKAERLSGSPWVVLREGDECFGPFVPTYRQGYFRP